jgi:hypothetical protein
MRRVAGRFCVAAGVLVLYGCPGMSPKDNARFQTVVAKNVAAGMPLATAVQHLRAAGFSCDDRAEAPDVTCTRKRQSLLPYACIQRVNLAIDSNRTTVTTVAPMPIACAGL